jgi:hypothetical protein
MEASGVKYCLYVLGFALNMEAECWSETSLHCYQPARFYSRDYANMHLIIAEFVFFFFFFFFLQVEGFSAGEESIFFCLLQIPRWFWDSFSFVCSGYRIFFHPAL